MDVEHPAGTDVLVLLGAVLVAAGKVDEGLTHLRRSEAAQPVAHLIIASHFADRGEKQSAEQEVVKYLTPAIRGFFPLQIRSKWIYR
jgi:hypothetical protein